MRWRRTKQGGAVGQPSWESSLLGDPGAKFLCGKLGTGKERNGRPASVSADPPTTISSKLVSGSNPLRKAELLSEERERPNPTHEKLTKSREHLSQSR